MGGAFLVIKEFSCLTTIICLKLLYESLKEMDIALAATDNMEIKQACSKAFDEITNVINVCESIDDSTEYDDWGETMN